MKAEEQLLKTIFGETTDEDVRNMLICGENFDEHDELDTDIATLEHYGFDLSNPIYSLLVMQAYHRND